MIRHISRILLVSAAAAFGAAGAANAQPVTIKLAWTVMPAELAPILLEAGVAKHHGTSYKLEPVLFRGTSLMVSALASGDINVAGLGYAAFSAAVQNAGMTDLRIFADDMQDGAFGHFSAPFLVRKEDPFKTIKDLKGKVLAVNAFGSGSDTALRGLLRQNGMDDKKDVTIIETSFSNMEAMLREKKVDLISGVLPFAEFPSLREFARVIHTREEVFGPTQTVVWAAHEKFLKDNRKAMVDFMEDTIRAIRWYMDPANQAKAIEIVARYSKQPPERFGTWLFTKKDYYRSPDAVPNMKAMQSNIDTEHKLGFLKSPLDLSKFVDLTIVEEANKRLR